MRAGGSSIANNTRAWSASLYGIKNWERVAVQFYPSPPMEDRVYAQGHWDKPIKEEWIVSILNRTPETPTKAQIQSIYYSTAKEVEDSPQFKDRTYDFKDIQSWKEVALQALVHAGWRPDCAMPQQRNIQETPAPKDPKGRIVFSTMTHMWDLPLGEGLGAPYGAWLRQEEGGLHIEASAFFQQNVGYSVTWERSHDKEITTQGWIMGYDTTHNDPPTAIIEGSLLHALRRVHHYLQTQQPPCGY